MMDYRSKFANFSFHLQGGEAMINFRKEDGALIMDLLVDRLDASVASNFRNKLIEIINDGNTLIILNLASVRLVDSSGLGSIVSGLKTLGEKGDLALCCIDERIMSMFRLTRMDRVFKIFKTEGEAISNISQRDKSQ
jgi:anti-sigma B factor antagonist